MLDKKYRPTDLETFFGNDVTINSLVSVVEREVDKIPKCILFCGPPGCGKTTLSRIVGNMLGAKPANVKEYNIGYTNGIDDAKRMIRNLQFAPLGGGNKVIILNECHAASKSFWNCMLEMLEEPPANVFFILCTTEPEKLPNPIKKNQRAMTFKVQELSRTEITKLVNYVLVQEEVSDISGTVIAEVCKASEGYPRRALTILDSIIDMSDEKDMLDFIKSDYYDEKSVIDLCRAIMAKKGWKTVSGILKDMKGDPETIRYQVLAYFSKVLLDPKPNNYVSAVISEFSESFVASKEGGLYNACYAVIVLYNQEE